MWTATVFDTETPGFKQDGIMQLAAVVIDRDFKVIGKFNSLIKPEFYGEVEEGAFAAHGITKERCEAHGIPLTAALGMLSNFIKTTDVAICHNYAYDSRVVSKCLSLLGKDNFLDRKRNFCTMNATTDLCKLPGKYGKHKWPKLQEAHKFLFGEEFESAHDALADVEATVRILQELKRKYPELLSRV